MFDYVRKHNKVMQLLLFVLIVPSFVLFGLEGYNRYSEKGEAVARVDGRDITQAEWDNAHRMEIESLRQRMPNLDPKLLDSEAAKYGTLERLVRDRVLAAAAEKSQLMVGDHRVARELQKNELIASLRKPDGTLDMDRYRQMLVAQGMTPEMYENQIRRDLATRQVLGGVNGTSILSTAVSGVALGSFLEKREVQVARFAPASFTGKVEPTEMEIEAYYKANPQLFQAPEQANIEYIVLDLETLSKGVVANESDMKTFYEQNIAKAVGGGEERRASHILIAAGKTASAEEKAKAKAKAQELLAELKKKPDAFAELAKKHSQDPGSAKNGGDLDFFARGAMTKPFEDAAFALKAKGDLSDVVESEFGYHIIRLTDIKTPKARPYEEVRGQIEAELRKQQAQKKYAESAETFTNTVYEQADSLKPAAEKLKLEIRTANGVQRTPTPGSTGVLANPKFLAALFSPDAVERKRNTEALEAGSSVLVSGRVVQHTPARTRPLAEVKAQVREKLVAERAAELARKEGQAKLAAWKAAPATGEFGAPITLSREDAQQQSRMLIEAALRVDPATLPALVGVDLGPEGYAVVKVNKVLPRAAASGDQAKQENALYQRTWTSAESLAYYNLLKERFKVQVKAPAPKEVAQQ